MSWALVWCLARISMVSLFNSIKVTCASRHTAPPPVQNGAADKVCTTSWTHDFFSWDVFPLKFLRRLWANNLHVFLGLWLFHGGALPLLSRCWFHHDIAPAPLGRLLSRWTSTRGPSRHPGCGQCMRSRYCKVTREPALVVRQIRLFARVEALCAPKGTSHLD